MRKTISWLITLTIILGICPVMAVNAAWDGQAATALQGSGTSASDPYIIESAADLKLVSELTSANANNEVGAYYKLTADIDYEGNEFTPIAAGKEFIGKFNGNGHVVRNFKITQARAANGFFADMKVGAEVYDLGIEDATINVTSGSGNLAGIFSGRTAGKITNCYVKNSSLTTNASLGIGAFTGGVRTESDVYTNCYAYNVDVNSTKGTPGGFFSYKDAEGQTFENCYVAEIRSNNASYYGFGLNIQSNVSNCFTTLADKGVTGTQGVALAKKDAIVNGLVAFDANCAYKVNSKINNGYPCMSYQKAAAYDNEYEVAMFTDADGIKVRIEENEAVADAVVYVATYDNDGRLIAAEALDVDTIVTSTLSTAGVKTIKVFVWDASNNSLALAKVINK